MTVFAISGHRPEKMKPGIRVDIERLITEELVKHDDPYVIQGMAAGVDLWAARAAFRADIPFECAIPFKGHEPRKDFGVRYDYEQALKYADKITYVTDYEKYPGAFVYELRNRYMIDNADLLIAVYNGSPGGTRNAVEYVWSHRHIGICKINPDTLEVGPIG
jgi:uncharacterized phage-like protein YoqJ